MSKDIEDRLNAIQRDVTEIKESLIGDLERPGHLTKFDRRITTLEDSDRARKDADRVRWRLLWGTMIGAATAAGAWIWDRLVGN